MAIINKKSLPFIAIVFFLVALGFFFIQHKNFSQNPAIPGANYVKIGGQMLKVDLALTPAEQEKGLSGKISLASNTGMLFIFPEPGKYYFWMKNMNFPIDMIWFDENLQVIFIQKDVLPESYPETFGPNQNSKYVLEVSAGFSEKNNLIAGDRLEILPF